MYTHIGNCIVWCTSTMPFCMCITLHKWQFCFPPPPHHHHRLRWEENMPSLPRDPLPYPVACQARPEDAFKFFKKVLVRLQKESKLLTTDRSIPIATVLARYSWKGGICVQNPFLALSDLKVQSKFKEITILESECHSWKKIIQYGLPHGQLSFLLRAGSDSLPHPAYLRRWNIQCASKCPLCSSTQPTTTHILNGCPTALQQGWFTWRHDSVLKSIFINLKDNLPHDVKIYADLDHWRAEDNLLPQSPLRSYPCHQDQILS